MITRREKRLIALMQLGLYLEWDSGHWWIQSGEDEWFSDYLRGYGVRVNNKIYGGVDEALNVIDEALKRMALPSLKQRFDESFQQHHIDGASDPIDRVETVEPGKGGG